MSRGYSPRDIARGIQSMGDCPGYYPGVYLSSAGILLGDIVRGTVQGILS